MKTNDVKAQNVVPVGNWVLVEKKRTNVTPGGILIPSQVDEFVPIVISIGPDVKDVREGDQLIIVANRPGSVCPLPDIDENLALVNADIIVAAIRR